ncbi:MAG: DUF4982 domain-containing protein [Bryobacterales bacterium]|nr:DUF4982 domain-containing protein [Bryobacterales bacterium]
MLDSTRIPRFAALALFATSGWMPGAPPRLETKKFSQGWYFRLGEFDLPGGGQAIGDFEARFRWKPVNLPHSFNAENTFIPVRGYYRGAGWYRKHVSLTDAQCAGKVFLNFGAAFSQADLWVNEQHVGRYLGGYTGFSSDVSDVVHPGDNVVAVRVTNVHNRDILPGREIPDYDLYGGLYREAALVLKDKLYIPLHGIRVTTPEVTTASARVKIEIAARNDYNVRRNCTAVAVVRDPAGRTVARLEATHPVGPFAEAAFTLEPDAIRNPALWSVDSPQLYSVQVTLRDGTREADTGQASFGLRWFEFRPGQGFFLNGKRVELHGVNRHQDYAGLANAVPPRLQVRDAELIREMGGNFVRTSHYPQHPAFLDACDRLGILVYEEIASWQFIGGERFARNAEAMLREMIERDRNHPSIILWGLFNEGRSAELFKRLNQVAHQADSTRPTIYADNKPEVGKTLGTTSIPDVLGINYRTEEIDKVHQVVGDLKLLCSEHTNFDRAVRGNPEVELAQIDRLKHNLDILESRPYLAGAALWSMHDYGTDYEPVWPEQHSGVLDSVRLPKEAFYYLKSRWTTSPMVHICNHWTWPGKEGVKRVVTVVSNCGTVELFLNGRSLGVRESENPARWEVAYESGVLRAVGRHGSRTVEHQVQTAGAPRGLKLATSATSLHANGADAAELTVTAVDGKGVMVPLQQTAVRFETHGPGSIRGIGGNPSVELRGGIGRIILQSGVTPGEITVTATAEGLSPAASVVKTE